MKGQLREVVANPSLRRVQLAFFGSTLGDWAYATAVTVWAWSVGGATAVGLFQAARFVVAAVSGPIGATVADRMSRKRFMMAVDAIRATLVAGGAVIVGLDGPPALVFASALAVTAVGASFRSAQVGLVPRLVDTPGQLTAANALAANLETVAMFTGPALGALLVGWADVATVFWLNVASYVWSLALLTAVRVPPAVADDAEPDQQHDEEHDEPEPSGSFLRETTAGFAELRRDRDLGAVAALAAAQGLLWGALTVLTVLIAVQMLHTGPRGVGFLDSVLGVGTLAGALSVLALAARGRLGRDMALGVLGWAIPLLAIAAFPSPVVAVAGLAVIGVSDAWVNLGLDTIPQRIAPERILSRVFSAVESSMIAAMAIGSLAAPLLVHVLGSRGTLLALGGAVTVLVLGLLVRMRRLDERLTEPAYLELVAAADLFAPLPRPTQETLARALEPVRYAAGEVIIAEGEPGDRFYLIAAGQVRVSQGGRDLRIEGAGEYFGEIALVRDVRRTATVVASTGTLVLGLAREDFLGALTGAQEATRIAEDVVSRRLAV